MFGKLAEAQKKAEEIKQRLGAISVTGVAASGKVEVMVDGNKKVKNITIHPDLMHADRKEELEDLLQIAMDDALEQAEKISAAEMKSLMSSMMPGIGGLFS